MPTNKTPKRKRLYYVAFSGAFALLAFAIWAIAGFGTNNPNPTSVERAGGVSDSDRQTDAGTNQSSSEDGLGNSNDGAGPTNSNPELNSNSENAASDGSTSQQANSNSQSGSATQASQQNLAGITSTTANPIGPDSPQSNSPPPISIQPPTTTTTTTAVPYQTPVTCVTTAVLVDAGEDVDPEERKVIVSVNVESEQPLPAVWAQLTWETQERNAMIQLSPSGDGTLLIPAPGSAPITAAIFVEPDFAPANQRCTATAR